MKSSEYATIGGCVKYGLYPFSILHLFCLATSENDAYVAKKPILTVYWHLRRYVFITAHTTPYLALSDRYIILLHSTSNHAVSSSIHIISGNHNRSNEVYATSFELVSQHYDLCQVSKCCEGLGKSCRRFTYCIERSKSDSSKYGSAVCNLGTGSL